MRTANQTFLSHVTCATVAVCPPPVRPDLVFCGQILSTLEMVVPNFLLGQTGYWGQMLARRQREIDHDALTRPHPPPLLSPEEVFAEVMHHLRIPTTSPLPMGLTPREADVLMLVALGATDREVAGEPHVGVRTVNSHVSAILRKISDAKSGRWITLTA